MCVLSESVELKLARDSRNQTFFIAENAKSAEVRHSREGGNPVCQHSDSPATLWIPAFAGMTMRGAGMTMGGAGMTGRKFTDFDHSFRRDLSHSNTTTYKHRRVKGKR